jgi:hypothetical protein
VPEFIRKLASIIKIRKKRKGNRREKPSTPN